MPGAPSVYFVVLLSVLSNIGLRGSRVLVSLSALHLGANSFMVGVLAALFSVFPLALALYAGRVSDRVGVRAPIVLGSAGMALALLLPCPTLIGLGQIFVQVSIQNAVGSIGGAEERAGNFGTFSLGASIATFVGPSLAGFSIDALGFRPTYFVLASMSLAVVVLALLFRRRLPEHGGEESAKPGGRALDLFRDGPLRRTLFMSGAALTGIELFSFYMPIYGKSIGLSATGIGLVLSAYAA